MFWREHALDELTEEQWESLCDGCGRCCLQKLEDADTGEVMHTNVACRLLDTERCRCTDYAHRFQRVKDCLSVRPITADKLRWLPSSCAYRRLAEGRDLADWHPLISGSAQSVHESGVGVGGRCVSEGDVDVADLPQYVVTWFDA